MSQLALAWVSGLICILIPFCAFGMAIANTKRRAYACPHCDNDVPPTAPNCPGCGAPMPDQDIPI